MVAEKQIEANSEAVHQQGFWPIILVSLWPFLSLLQDHHGLLTFAGIARLFSFSCFLMVVLFAIVFLLQKMTACRFQPLAMGVSAFNLMFFMFADLNPVIGGWLYMLGIILLPLFISRVARNDKVAVIVSMAMIVPVIYLCLSVGYQVSFARYGGASEMVEKTDEITTTITPLFAGEVEVPAIKPNVYFIIVDGYPRADIQKRVFDLDNQPFLKMLRTKGFSIQEKAKSNYAVTHVSLSSVMEADYIATDKHGPSPALSLAFYDQITGENQTVRQFKEFGYQYLHLGGRVYSISACSTHADECLNQSMPLLKFMDIALIKKTPLQLWMKEILAISGSDRPTSLEDLIAALDKMKLEKTSEPFFLLAHTIPPHAPFLYEENCDIRDEKLSLFESLHADTMEPYRDGIICVNSQLEQVVSKINDKDSNAIVIIQSDHGSHFNVDWFAKLDQWSDQALNERFSILSAIKAPEECQEMLSDDWMSINTFRFVFACLTQSKPHYLDPAFYATTYAVDAADHGKVQRYDEIPDLRSNQ